MAKVFVIILFSSTFLLKLCSCKEPVYPHGNTTTFTGSGTVILNLGDKMLNGKFTIARNGNKSMGVEYETFPSSISSIPAKVSKAILRYDKNMTYYIRGEINSEHCLAEDREFNGIPNFWGWLNDAKPEGIVKLSDGVTYQINSTSVSGIQFEFGKPLNNTSKTLFQYWRNSPENLVQYIFTDYSEKVPDDSLFDVPSFC